MMSLRFAVVLAAFIALIVDWMAPDAITDLMSAAHPLLPSAPVLEALLCVLMFAAAVQLRPQGPWRTVVLTGNLVALTTVLAVAMVAAGTRWVCNRIGIDLSPALAFAFAALITPTEPLAMLRAAALGGSAAIGRRVMAEPLLACMAGLVIYEIALARSEGYRGAISAMVLEQAGGAVLLGMCLGLATLWLVRIRPGAALAALAAVGAVAVSWYAGRMLPLNGPFAAACAGLFMAFQRDAFFGDVEQRERFETWSARVANGLSALLPLALVISLLAGGEISGHHLAAAVFLLPLIIVLPRVLAAAAVWLIGLRVPMPTELPKVAAWSGVRGGFAVALVLMLPATAGAEMVAVATLVVLLFSLLMQWPAYGLYLLAKRPLAQVPVEEPGEAVDGSNQTRE